MRVPDMFASTRDGRQLHDERHGEGNPVVVFEAGMGFSRNSWGAVIPGVAEHATVIAYDRSGLGRSAPDAARRDLARLTDDLVDLLDHLGAGPFVLVGHGWGGPIVRSAAARIPERIGGLVLVDPTDERCDVFFSAGYERQRRLARPVIKAMTRTRVLRLIVRRQSKAIPEPWGAARRAEEGTVASVGEHLAELEPSTVDLRALRERPIVWPEVPVTVISGGVAGFIDRGRREELVATHRTTARRLAQGRHVVADQSGHDVPLTEPGLIIDEILRIVGHLRVSG
jgi:pimeloyl-ACP methyl ester carboxylesterase